MSKPARSSLKKKLLKSQVDDANLYFREVPTLSVEFANTSRMQEFNKNNEPSKIKKVGAGNTPVSTMKLVGYTKEGAPIYETTETPKYMKKMAGTKHPKSNPKLKKTYVHLDVLHTSENPMEESMLMETPESKYVAVYHRADKAPVNNNDIQVTQSNGAAAPRGILRKNPSGTQKKQVSHKLHSKKRIYYRGNAPENVGKPEIPNSINRVYIGKKQPVGRIKKDKSNKAN